MINNECNKIQLINQYIDGFRAVIIHPINLDKFKDCFENVSWDENNVNQAQQNNFWNREAAGGLIDTVSANAKKPPTSVYENEINLDASTNTPSPSSEVFLADLIRVPSIPVKTKTATK